MGSRPYFIVASPCGRHSDELSIGALRSKGKAAAFSADGGSEAAKVPQSKLPRSEPGIAKNL